MSEAPATSIGAACGRLFRLRKAAMLSRHWRLWLSFPPEGPFRVDAVEHFDVTWFVHEGMAKTFATLREF